MNKRRVTLTVEVNLDGSGYGTFSTPESAEETVQRILNEAIPHYVPFVKLANRELTSDEALAELRARLS